MITIDSARKAGERSLAPLLLVFSALLSLHAAGQAPTGAGLIATGTETSATAAEVSAMTPGQHRAGDTLTVEQVAQWGTDAWFSADTLTPAVKARMQGRSLPEGSAVSTADLRYLRLLHRDAEGRILVGEMVCHRSIAADLTDIFRQLYDAAYPVERMVLIDDYGADDEASMSANNTSCFCYRPVAGTRTLSKHARGLAVDVNTRYNPYVRRRADGTIDVSPRNGAPWADRRRPSPYKVSAGDLCHRLFLAHGFRWGGSWRTVKDYQHFEK